MVDPAQIREQYARAAGFDVRPIAAFDPSPPAGRRLNVRFLEELTAGRNGLNLSPTACRNEGKGPSNRRGASARA
jgi:hypothetical protein